MDDSTAGCGAAVFVCDPAASRWYGYRDFRAFSTLGWPAIKVLIVSKKWVQELVCVRLLANRRRRPKSGNWRR